MTVISRHITDTYVRLGQQFRVTMMTIEAHYQGKFWSASMDAAIHASPMVSMVPW